ncbi:MAG TPA: XRE family transcriptional regulator [Chthonomonadales bacterium]|nr:XRE family transcriptional regulator [Chthonomonadales bacterium]
MAHMANETYLHKLTTDRPTRSHLEPTDSIEPPPVTLGGRLQRIRFRRGLSVRELAELAGVNKNTILRLEKGLTPSYGTLTRVCEALGIHVAQLTQPEPEEEGTIALHDRQQEVWWPHSASRDRLSPPPGTTVVYQGADRRQLFASDEKVLLSVLACRLPGGRINAAVLTLFSESEPVAHPGEELVFCLRGVARLTVAGRSYTLHEGDAATFWCSERHSYAPADEIEDPDDLPVVILSVWIDAREERAGNNRE